MNDLTIYAEMKPIAEALAKSTLIPASFKSNNDAYYAILYGQELGLKPIYSLNNVSVIKGKPGLSADAMLAIAKSNPEYGGITIEDSAEKCRVTLKRKYKNGAEDVRTVEFTIQDARKAGLVTPNSNWEKYPQRMLKARAVAFACRDTFPDVLAGIYTPDELKYAPDEKEIDQIPASHVQTVPYQEVPQENLTEITALMNKVTQEVYNCITAQKKIDEYKQRVYEAFTARDMVAMQAIYDEIRDNYNKALARKTAKQEQRNDEVVLEPEEVQVAEQSAKEYVVKVCDSLVANGWNPARLANSVKKHLGISFDGDWKAGVLSADVDDLDVWRKAYSHWKAVLDGKTDEPEEVQVSQDLLEEVAGLILAMPDGKEKTKCSNVFGTEIKSDADLETLKQLIQGGKQ